MKGIKKTENTSNRKSPKSKIFGLWLNVQSKHASMWRAANQIAILCYFINITVYLEKKAACLAFAEGYLQLVHTVYVALGHAFDRPIDLKHLMRDIYQSTVTALFI